MNESSDSLLYLLAACVVVLAMLIIYCVYAIESAQKQIVKLRNELTANLDIKPPRQDDKQNDSSPRAAADDDDPLIAIDSVVIRVENRANDHGADNPSGDELDHAYQVDRTPHGLSLPVRTAPLTFLTSRILTWCRSIVPYGLRHVERTQKDAIPNLPARLCGRGARCWSSPTEGVGNDA